MRLSQQVCFSKVIITMFLLGGCSPPPKLDQQIMQNKSTDSPYKKLEGTLLVGTFCP